MSDNTVTDEQREARSWLSATRDDFRDSLFAPKSEGFYAAPGSALDFAYGEIEARRLVDAGDISDKYEPVIKGAQKAAPPDCSVLTGIWRFSSP